MRRRLGTQYAARLDEPVDATDRTIFAALSDEDVERLVGLLEELRVQAQGASDGRPDEG